MLVFTVVFDMLFKRGHAKGKQSGQRSLQPVEHLPSEVRESHVIPAVVVNFSYLFIYLFVLTLPARAQHDALPAPMGVSLGMLEHALACGSG